MPWVSMATRSASWREKFSTRWVSFTRSASISDRKRRFVAFELNRALSSWSAPCGSLGIFPSVARRPGLERVPSSKIT